MSNRCENLRADALLSGLDSEEGQRWRVHAESCEQCEQELRIMLDLRDTSHQNLHLKRDSVEKLFREVDSEGQKYRSVRPLRFALSVACCVAVVACGILLYQTGGAITLSNAERTGGAEDGATAMIAADVLERTQFHVGVLEFTNAFAEDPSGGHRKIDVPDADAIDARLARLRGEIAAERADIREVCRAALLQRDQFTSESGLAFGAE